MTWNFPKESIQNMVCISTGHITESDMMVLNRVVSYKCKYGAMLAINDELEETILSKEIGISDNLKNIIKLAKESNIDYVMFDADCPQIDGLELFDW